MIAKESSESSSNRTRRGRDEGRRAPGSAPLDNSGVLLRAVAGERAARLDEGVRPFGGEHGAVGIDRNAFTRNALLVAVFAFERLDELYDAVLAHRADADAIAPVRVAERRRFGVDGVERLTLDEQAAQFGWLSGADSESMA